MPHVVDRSNIQHVIEEVSAADFDVRMISGETLGYLIDRLSKAIRDAVHLQISEPDPSVSNDLLKLLQVQVDINNVVGPLFMTAPDSRVWELWLIDRGDAERAHHVLEVISQILQFDREDIPPLARRIRERLR